MGILSRSILRQVVTSSFLGTVLFTFVIFLESVGRLFETLVRTSAPLLTFLHIFALAIPSTLSYTVPLGVLMGVLITLNRMSTDGEITAMRAAGVSSRKVVTPILVFATFAMLVNATATLWLTPDSIWKTYQILNKQIAAELTAEVQPRVFNEQFPNKVIYVEDVITGPLNTWHNVFLADTTPPEERANKGHEHSPEPVITVASRAVAVPDVSRNLIQLSMKNSSTFEVGKDITEYYKTAAPKSDRNLQASRPDEKHAKEYTELDSVPLYRIAYHDKTLTADKLIEARLQFQNRLVLPPACILLALIGIPLGVSTRKGGRSTAFVLTAALAFLYWMGLIAMDGLAKQRKLPVEIASWAPNAVFAVIGIIMLVRLESPGHVDVVGMVRGWFEVLFSRFRGRRPASAPAVRRGGALRRFPLIAQIVDRYVLGGFLFYFVLMLASLVFTFHVYTFFELLSDMVRNNIAMSEMLEYLFFLTPKLIYEMSPISVLVAVLITFGILTKHNEITAFKACGVSQFRMAIPVVLVAGAFSVGLFGFDQTYLPKANRIQDSLRNHIKGKAPQTYADPKRKWIMGQNSSRIYYYKYLDPISKTMADVSVYELDPATYNITRHISAERAKWEPRLHAWVFENGWSRRFEGSKEIIDNYEGQTMTFPELTEGPDWFLREVVQEQQMNVQQLKDYIHNLQVSGFDTISLQVQFYRKFSVPLFALIMAVISIPFAFLAGNRGAMAGVGISLGIAIAYEALSHVSEQLGDVALLPTVAAAWAPDAVFFLAGFYFFSRMRT